VWGAGFHLPAGGKTGTTNDGTNVWFIGYTADLVAGVWMGFDRPEKIMYDAQGGRLAAPAWTQFMSEVYRRKPAPPDWPRPIDIITRDIDVSTGQLQTPYCPRDLIRTEFYIPGTEPTIECQKHVVGGYPSSLDTLGRAPLPPPDTFSRIPPPLPPPPTDMRVNQGASPVPRAAPRGDTTHPPTVFDTTQRTRARPSRPPPPPPPKSDTDRVESSRIPRAR
jgi:membrane peptidoglycan carboxypeptidase